MRTAEEILNKIYHNTIEKDGTKSIQPTNFPSAYSQIAKEAINEARKEAIKECANAVRREYDKEAKEISILKLINELK